jgi:hypothetical protein
VPAFAQPAPLAARINVVIALGPPLGPLKGTLERITNADGTTRTLRIVWDVSDRLYFGYDLLVEPIEGDEYRATFLPLDMQDSTELPLLKAWTPATRTPLPSPRTVHPGDSMTLTLSPKLGDSLNFEMAQRSAEQRALSERVKQPSPEPFEPLAFRTLIRTIEGPARDFSGGEPAMKIWLPDMTINGVAGLSSIAAIHMTSWLPWIYLPGRGRFILSLLPLLDAGFSLAGESRGSVIRLKAGQDTVELQSLIEVAAPGSFAYNLYVRAEPGWIPTSRSERDQPLMGTADLAELNRR